MTSSIGIDGGQSEIRARFADRVETLKLPGVSRLDGDLSEPIIEITNRLCSSDPAEPIERLVAGLTALPFGDELDALAETLRDITGATEVWLGDDSATSHAGALEGRTGVVLAVGTGAVALAVDAAAGRPRIFDGAGYLLGDEGGGFWIGRHAIRAALRASEGRGPATSLEERIESDYGPLDSLADRLHSRPRAVASIALAAATVIEAAAEGDDVASQILCDAADRLATTASTAVAGLGSGTDLAFTGRLVEPGQPLRMLVEERLDAMAIGVRVVDGGGTSLDGACRLASGLDLDLYRPLFRVTTGPT